MVLLDGRHAVVTGGASGIGLATAKRLLAEGAAVAVADVNPAGVKVAADIGAHFLQGDLSDSRAVASTFRSAEDVLGAIDIAYLNAGVTTRQTDITRLTDEQYRRIVGINVDGVVFGAREAARAIERAGGGAIVATASIAGLIAYASDPIYALTKHAVVGLVRALAQQLKTKNITINAICPGITETPLVGEEAAKRLKAAGFPLVSPDAIASAVVEAITGGHTGECFVCQPDRIPERYQFRGVPGPRTPGAEGRRPPGLSQ